jgi:hypothetical protein
MGSATHSTRRRVVHSLYLGSGVTPEGKPSHTVASIAEVSSGCFAVQYAGASTGDLAAIVITEHPLNPKVLASSLSATTAHTHYC